MRELLAARDVRSLCGGIAVAIIGAVAIYVAAGYDMGSARRMGPGFYPVMVSTLVLVSGLAMIGQALLASRLASATRARLSIRSMFAVTLSIMAFAFLVSRFGLIPAAAAAVLLAGLADPKQRPVHIILLAAVVAGSVSLLFIFALGMPIRAVRWG